jgi:flagellin-like hook-associated protein FlgL
MAISGLGTQSLLQVERLVSMRRQLDDLQRQLGTQKRSDTYAGIGLDRGLTISLRTKLAGIAGFDGSIQQVDSRLKLAQTALADLGSAARTVKTAIPKATYVIDQGGRTQDQATARGQLDRMLGALNTQFGDQYIFSGLSPDKAAVATTDEILNGVGPRAGLIRLITERNQADLGTSGLGRLVIPATTSTSGSLAGTTATLAPDAPAVATGTANLGAPYASAGGTLDVNGITVAIPPGADGAAVRDAINTAMAAAPPGTPLVTASLDGSNRLVLTGADADTAVAIGAGSTPALLAELGLSTGTTNPTNLLTQAGGVTAGQTLTVAIGASTVAVTFGTGAGQVSTMAELNAALGALTGGTAAVNPANGNLTVTASSSTGVIRIGGTAPAATFGLAATSASPTNVVSIGEDIAGSVFGFKLSAIATTVAGASVTQPAGSPKTMSVDLGGTLPKAGDTVTLSFTLPDGTNENLVLTAVATPKSLVGAGGFAAPGAVLGGAPGPITIQAPTLNGGVPVTISTLTASDTASTASAKISAALAALPGGNAGVTATNVGGQVVLKSTAGEQVVVGGDSPTLDGLGFPAGNRIATVVDAPTEANQFAIGTTQAETLANLHALVNTSVGTLARTSLAAASAVQAANEFFNADGAHPVKRVAGPPFDSATALVDGTDADTLKWYTGEAGPTSARSTSTARIDPEITVSYGMRANEQAFRIPLANIAAMAAVSFSPSDTDGQGRFMALMQRVGTNLGNEQGVQKIGDVMADLGGAQASVKTAKERHTQASATLTDLLESVEGVPMEETASVILALQTSLSASLQTTALLSKLNLTNFL